MEHERSTLGIAAVWGLGYLGGPEAVALLKPILKNGRSADPRTSTSEVTVKLAAEAARALVVSGDASGIDAAWDEFQVTPRWGVGPDSNDRNVWFRLAAVDSLALSPAPHAYLKVVGILKGNDISARWEAIRAMASGTMADWFRDEWMESQRVGELPVPALKDARVLQALMDVVEDRVAKPQEAPKHAKTAQKWAKEARELAMTGVRKSGNSDALAFVEKLEAHEGTIQPKPQPFTPDSKTPK